MSKDFISVCEKCKKPVVEGEARNGLTDNHWLCDFPSGHRPDPFEEMRKAEKRFRELATKIDQLKEKLK